MRTFERDRLIWQNWQLASYERASLIWGLDIPEAIKDLLLKMNEYAGGNGVFWGDYVSECEKLAANLWIERVSNHDWRIRFDLMGFRGPDKPPRPQRKSPHLKHRSLVFDRDGYKCVYCGSAKDLSLDHKIPQSRGGSHEVENLVTCCISCNSSKRDLTPEEWGGRKS